MDKLPYLSQLKILSVFAEDGPTHRALNLHAVYKDLIVGEAGYRIDHRNHRVSLDSLEVIQQWRRQMVASYMLYKLGLYLGKRLPDHLISLGDRPLTAEAEAFFDALPVVSYSDGFQINTDALEKKFSGESIAPKPRPL